VIFAVLPDHGPSTPTQEPKGTPNSYSYFPNESFRTFLRPTFYTELPNGIFGCIQRRQAAESCRSGEETSMTMGPKGCEEDLSSRCCVCGRIEELFELPGRTERYCVGCSTDIATASLLETEIDAATLAGQDASFLISEYEQLGARLLSRSQSAELDSF
jgi:hypothetical protein